MKEQDGLWDLFVKTGLPQVYLLYKEKKDGRTQDGAGDTHDGRGGE